ncbi:hypothetical protein ACOME3_007839 [Neoechinorhynchus agilis]
MLNYLKVDGDLTNGFELSFNPEPIDFRLETWTICFCDCVPSNHLIFYLKHYLVIENEDPIHCMFTECILSRLIERAGESASLKDVLDFGAFAMKRIIERRNCGNLSDQLFPMLYLLPVGAESTRDVLRELSSKICEDTKIDTVTRRYAYEYLGKLNECGQVSEDFSSNQPIIERINKLLSSSLESNRAAGCRLLLHNRRSIDESRLHDVFETVVKLVTDENDSYVFTAALNTMVAIAQSNEARRKRAYEHCSTGVLSRQTQGKTPLQTRIKLAEALSRLVSDAGDFRDYYFPLLTNTLLNVAWRNEEDSLVRASVLSVLGDLFAGSCDFVDVFGEVMNLMNHVLVIGDLKLNDTIVRRSAARLLLKVTRSVIKNQCIDVIRTGQIQNILSCLCDEKDEVIVEIIEECRRSLQCELEDALIRMRSPSDLIDAMKISRIPIRVSYCLVKEVQ